MSKQFIKASFDLECKYEGLPPVYRIYVNDELFCERQWSWANPSSIRNTLQLMVEPGFYKVDVHTVGPCLAQLRIKNNNISLGRAHWAPENRIAVAV